MKKYILMVLCAMLLTGCAAKKSDECWGANINESILHETITYENVEIETFETNTSNWD